jgi:hypothetical protein
VARTIQRTRQHRPHRKPIQTASHRPARLHRALRSRYQAFRSRAAQTPSSASAPPAGISLLEPRATIGAQPQTAPPRAAPPRSRWAPAVVAAATAAAVARAAEAARAAPPIDRICATVRPAGLRHAVRTVAHVKNYTLHCRMPNLVETAVRTYIRAWSERDRAVRAALIEECFAADGRFVTRSRLLRGRRPNLAAADVHWTARRRRALERRFDAQARASENEAVEPEPRVHLDLRRNGATFTR